MSHGCLARRQAAIYRFIGIDYTLHRWRHHQMGFLPQCLAFQHKLYLLLLSSSKFHKIVCYKPFQSYINGRIRHARHFCNLCRTHAIESCCLKMIEHQQLSCRWHRLGNLRFRTLDIAQNHHHAWNKYDLSWHDEVYHGSSESGKIVWLYPLQYKHNRAS